MELRTTESIKGLSISADRKVVTVPTAGVYNISYGFYAQVDPVGFPYTVGLSVNGTIVNRYTHIYGANFTSTNTVQVLPANAQVTLVWLRSGFAPGSISDSSAVGNTLDFLTLTQIA
jgi:hypothetical protein